MSKTQPQRYGKYILLRRIAVGGMAEIFKAKVAGAQGFEKDLVIKRILPHFNEDEDFVRMFVDEARITAKLQHPNIVQIFDFDVVDGTYYIAMEYIEGKDLKEVMERAALDRDHLSVFQCVWIGIEIAKGLHYAHTKEEKGKPLNIVHRDVTPSNVMISYRGDVKLMDFGIAKAAQRSTKTQAGAVKGKVAYMSPEQARGKQLDGRSDVFALGVMLWEALTERRLFVAESDFDTLTNVLKMEAPPPSSINPEVPEDLDPIIAQCLAKDTEKRFASAEILARELTRWFYSHVADLDKEKLKPLMCRLFKEELDTLEELAEEERAGLLGLRPGASSDATAKAPARTVTKSWRDEATHVAKPLGDAETEIDRPAVSTGAKPRPRVEAVHASAGRAQATSVDMALSRTVTAEAREGHGEKRRAKGPSLWILLILLVLGGAAAALVITLTGGPGPGPGPGRATAEATVATATSGPTNPTALATANARADVDSGNIQPDAVAQADAGLADGAGEIGLAAADDAIADAGVVAAVTSDAQIADTTVVKITTPVELLIALEPAVEATVKSSAGQVEVKSVGLVRVSGIEPGVAFDLDLQATGFKPVKRTLTLREPHETLTIKLEKIGSTPPIIPVGGGKGTLQISARPWAQVTVNGRPYGTTPQTIRNLTPGAYTIILTKGAKTLTKRVTVAGGKQAQVFADMTE